MRVCPTCSEAAADTVGFCPACGSELASPRAHTDPGVPGAEATSVPVAASSAGTAALLGASVDGRGSPPAGSAAEWRCGVVDGFQIGSVLASGAFATVYRARQLGIGRAVALKVPTHEIAVDPVMAKRFAREARAAARVRHPGVVTIYAVGELPDGRPYLAMELVDGAPLTEVLVGGALAPVRVLRLGRLIASALAETHAAGVIHRDLKPSNIIWRRDRSGDDRITIVDFGIAVAKPGDADATRLTVGGLIGTPHYMSPEQAHGEAVDGRADLYALGCILYELVTGVTLFDGSGYEVLLAHLGKPAPRAREHAPAVPLALDELIADLVMKRPEDRPASADAVIAQIDAALGDLELVSEATRVRAPRAKRPTAGTRRDLPPKGGDARRGFAGTTIGDLMVAAAADVAPAQMSVRRARWIAGAAVALAALAGGGLLVARLAAGHHARVERATPAVAQPGERAYARDDGETTLHMTLTDPLRAGGSMTAHMQLWNKLGQPIVETPVLTIEDPHGVAKGFNAKPTSGDQFEFTRRLPLPGRYVLRVFPGGTDSELDVELEVAAPVQPG